MTGSLTTGWIMARVEQEFDLDGVSWPDLQAIGLSSFGLRPSPWGGCDQWFYQSRPYHLLGYELAPQLLFNVQRSSESLELTIVEVLLSPSSMSEDWHQVHGMVSLTPASIGVHALHSLELSLARRGPLSIVPRMGLKFFLEKAVCECNTRIGRALARRLREACSGKTEGTKA